MEAATISEAKEEYYHHTYPELCQLLGEAGALEKVALYQNLIQKHGANWVIGNCELLATYQNPSLAPLPPLLDAVVSVFYRPVTNTTHQKQLTLHAVVNLIRGDAFRYETDQLRTIKAKKENRQYKATAFSYATFSGTFNHRDDAGLDKHSGLICIDIDHLESSLPEIRAAIIADPATVVCFISPNGDGLKVLYEMDIAKHSQQWWYEGYREYLSGSFGLDMGKLDPQCKNVSRACFLPHDPTVFINPHFVTQ
ncbi:hypothetical protein MKJ04_11445 [Pontibacter sp. E15-1]|uniref:BT4734/BF3469 family protein n=1 Tax=Pontibacter sp. E15-1 TaxID=2919918 RepID=UPI001F4F80C6|nr:BT4734/BF3469 family protein [Pontibacter sp. E15-1]MCJ8165458.1 hypothetical protein [Pontibacter sp. E15-1]